MVAQLYEVGAKPEAEDAQLRTGSDTVSPGPGREWKKKSLKGSEKPLKSVLSGRSRGSDSIFGSWSLIDCRFQFLTVYISVYDSSASHVLRVRCKDLSRERLLVAVLQLSRRPDAVVWNDSLAQILRVVGASCWPNNPSETDGKQIKRRPSTANTRIHSDYITLTSRLFNEPRTKYIDTFAAALLLSPTHFTLIVFMANWVIHQLSC